MINSRILFCLLIFLGLSSCDGDQSDELKSMLGWSLSREEFDAYIESQLEGKEVPGLSIALINDGALVHRYNYGWANLADSIRVTDVTIFEGASISKPVFAYFVMKFVEEGKLDLDRPLQDYYPHPDLSDEPWAELLTARIVLSHQSGLPNWREENENNVLSFQFEPGTEYGYSGEAYQYLAEVLREIEQTDWDGLEAIFQQKVAKPLGMKHTVFIQNDYTRLHKAEPYDSDGNWIDWKNEYWFNKNDTAFVAPASIHSEPADFTQWMIAIMNSTGLSEDSFDEMLSPQVNLPDAPLAAFYSLGFVRVDLPNFDIYMHTGNNEGFSSYFVLDRSSKWGFVLFSNSEYGEELGLTYLLYLFAGPKIKYVFVGIGIAVTTLLVAVGYGLYKLIRFIIS